LIFSYVKGGFGTDISIGNEQPPIGTVKLEGKETKTGTLVTVTEY